MFYLFLTVVSTVAIISAVVLKSKQLELQARQTQYSTREIAALQEEIESLKRRVQILEAIEAAGEKEEKSPLSDLDDLVQPQLIRNKSHA
jgi:cell division protein FtsL